MSRVAKKNRKFNQRGRLNFRLIIFGFVLLVIIFIVIPYYLTKRDEDVVEGEGGLVPSEVVNNKSKYNREEIVIRGKVSAAPVVCERKNCPSEDPCCGCPAGKDLLITDPGTVLTAKTGERLRLLSYRGELFCRRLPASCDYNCQDWIEGAIYDIQGMFFAEPPPSGWKLSLEQYFEVEDKRLVRKTGFMEVVENILVEIKGILGKFGTPSTYVLD